MRHPFDGIVSYEEIMGKPVQGPGDLFAEQTPTESKRPPTGKLNRRSMLSRLLGSAALAVGVGTGALGAAAPATPPAPSSGVLGGRGFNPAPGASSLPQPRTPASPGSQPQWRHQPAPGPGQVTTYALGEEGSWQRPGYSWRSWRYPTPGQGDYTTQALGEEGGTYTTQALGEEGGTYTTQALGEEGGTYTTQALGEEGGTPYPRWPSQRPSWPTTYALGEEGGWW